MSSAAAAVSTSDLVLGRYRPLEPLGSGGSGSVWRARDEGSGVDVALKIVPREGKAAARAEREATAAARLRHEHCLRSYALARDARHVYIAYEYVPGRTLREALRAGEVDDLDAVEAAAQIADALAHAHARGIIHRDVKPSNVLLADGEELSIRLLDFGLARMDNEETLTAAGDVPGTLAYIPPERLRGDMAGPAADVWAVGVLLWESLAGWHPFWKGSLLDTARRIETGAVSLARPRPDLPKPLIALVDRALSIDPARRPSAERLAAGLREAYAERVRERRSRSLSIPEPGRFAPAAAAGFVAGWSAAALPFYPSGWPLLLAAVAATLALVRDRAGLAFALAVPILPLGNLSAGLAWLYAAVAVVWLTISWRDARSGLFFAAGPFLGALGLLPLIPLASQVVRGHARRAAQAGAALLVTALVAGLNGAMLPFAGARAPRVSFARSDHPLAIASVLWHVLSSHPAVLAEAVGLAAAAAFLPLARRHGTRGAALFGIALLAAIALPAVSISTIPLVLAVAVTSFAIAAAPLSRS